MLTLDCFRLYISQLPIEFKVALFNSLNDRLVLMIRASLSRALTGLLEVEGNEKTATR